MQSVFSKLKNAINGTVKEKEPLAYHTTMKIGGPADIFIEPRTIEDLRKAMDVIVSDKMKWTVIGRGSNLLVADDGIEGVVIKFGKGFAHLELEQELLRVGAGYPLVALATKVSKQGYAGLEFASGIPGSVGGAVFMNAGAHQSDIATILEKAYILFPNGEMHWLTNEEMKFSYRTSILQKERPGIVVEAIFRLVQGEKEAIIDRMLRNKAYRKETQPWDSPCAGSIFRNPLPHHAGQLIEAVGLKGHSLGGAQISPMHGNFIVNSNQATAEDVLGLIQHAKDTVLAEKGIALQTEVEIIGRK
ncbi:UDP-N-acetylmuramate dehydrogenase [Cytobacillus sp. FSL R7-0680]|uniref:UDP-N-acetylmuramate dehydrogenase n=1 Tax=Cytobacillus sp. FSL R7-0680 TaxID=2921689 RepID=UPI0030F63B51